MSLPNSDSRALFLGNGATTEFPFSFKVWDTAELVVSVENPDGLTSVAAGWTATLTETGGTVSYRPDGRPLPEGYRLAITRNMPFVQEVELISGTRFDPGVVETALDQACAERQELREKLSRAVVLPSTSEEGPQDVVDGIYAARDEAVDSAGSAARSAASAASSAAGAAGSAATASSEADRAKTEADRAHDIANVGPATADKPGLVTIGRGIGVDAKGVISVEPIALASRDAAGIVRVGQGLDISGEGLLSASIPDAFPAGGIILWSGAADAIPTGWALCDGANGTPDLRDRFIMGAGGSHAVGATGGSGDFAALLSVGGTTLTEAQMPSHSHVNGASLLSPHSRPPVTYYGNRPDGNHGGDGYMGTTYAAGSSGSHTHSLSAISGSALPPYYALCYIMKR